MGAGGRGGGGWGGKRRSKCAGPYKKRGARPYHLLHGPALGGIDTRSAVGH